MTAKRRRLLDLSIRETSGVDHPANFTQTGGAEGWLVMKAAKAKTCPECSSPLLAGVDRCPKGHTVKADKEAPDMSKPTGRAAQLVKAAQAVADARAAVEANPGDAEAIKTLETALADVVAVPEGGDGGDTADVTALNARIAELEGQLAGGDGTDADEAAELAKAAAELPEPLRKAFEKAQADAAEASKAAAKAAADAAVEKAARLNAEFVTKAQAYSHVGKADELGPVLRSISEGAPDALPAVERILSAFQAQAEAGDLFKSVGKNGERAGGRDARMTTIRQKAEEYRLAKAAAGDTITIEQAISDVVALEPNLAAETKEN